jgi:prepilin-type N-terminal cleavage/methylation domain-containing protein
MAHIKLRKQSAGFTIVELMIATLVFGVVLLVVTTAIMQFTRVYYKGITETKLQDINRNIVDSISQGIQFNGGNVTTTVANPAAGSSYAFCVGNLQYSYTTGYMLSDSPTAAQTYHALVANTVAGCTGSSAAQNVRSATISGRELLSPNMRISRLQVTNPSPNVYKVSVRIVYGDDTILNNPNAATANCLGQRQGTQFCAVSDITTTVVKRVQ